MTGAFPDEWDSIAHLDFPVQDPGELPEICARLREKERIIEDTAAPLSERREAHAEHRGIFWPLERIHQTLQMREG
ncbi:hypothetical protein [Parafrankia soli]|uniref:hypothetical protein n=1 Tax=Parafrankia soli TaxID=2599596 RepID=UPI001041C768|nr:hypothetical protein [Parafrankia soli]